jgi:hypothetical protein
MVLNEPLAILLEHIALAASMSTLATIATNLLRLLLAAWGDALVILPNPVRISLTRCDLAVAMTLDVGSLLGAGPLVVTFLIAVTATHVLSSLPL